MKHDQETSYVTKKKKKKKKNYEEAARQKNRISSAPAARTYHIVCQDEVACNPRRDGPQRCLDFEWEGVNNRIKT